MLNVMIMCLADCVSLSLLSPHINMGTCHRHQENCYKFVVENNTDCPRNVN